MVLGVATANGITEWSVITDLVVILVSAAVIAVVVQRMRLAAIPAYLIAGAVVGPRALLHIVPTQGEPTLREQASRLRP